MRRHGVLALILACTAVLAGCGRGDSHEIKITVPAGHSEDFAYSADEISATGNKISISSGEGLGDTEVILSPVDGKAETGYVASYLTPGMPVEFDAAPGEWFRIGVSVQNDADEDITVSVKVKGVEIRPKTTPTGYSYEDSFVPEPITFVWEGEGFGGDFIVVLEPYNTFQICEGPLSSTIYRGYFSVDGEVLTLRDSATSEGHKDFKFRINADKTELTYIAEGSEKFPICKPEDGALFSMESITSAVEDPDREPDDGSAEAQGGIEGVAMYVTNVTDTSVTVIVENSTVRDDGTMIRRKIN